MDFSADQLDDLEADDPRPSSQRIANRLRAAILTRRFAPGDQLPSQGDLARRYGVARETVKKALRILTDERLIITRQGTGTFVRAQTERPVGLRPHVEAAFQRRHVTVDFAGFTGETLHTALQEPLDKIRAGRLAPESVTVRILLPDLGVPAMVPSPVDGPDDGPAARERAARIARRHTEAITASLGELGDLGLVHTTSVAVRTCATAPMFKLYILNDEEAFFGFYPVVTHTVTLAGASVDIYDVLGKDVPLFHFASGDQDDAIAVPYVQQARAWFDSVWTTIAREFEH